VSLSDQNLITRRDTADARNRVAMDHNDRFHLSDGAGDVARVPQHDDLGNGEVPWDECFSTLRERIQAELG